MRLPRKSESLADYVVPEPGLYVLELSAYGELEPSQYDPAKQRIKLSFTIVGDEDHDGAYEGSKLNQFYGFSMHPKSKLYPIIKALSGGEEIDEDEDIDLDDLVGKRIRGTLDVTEKPRRDDPSQTAQFANLVAAAPVRKKKANGLAPQKTFAAAKAARRAEQLHGDDDKDDGAELWDDDDEA